MIIDQHPDLVVHAAALVDVDRRERDPSAAERLHVGTTRTIRDAIEPWGGTLIYISTDSVFDGRKVGAYMEEDQPAPQNAYAWTKAQGETVALMYRRATVLRTNIFGWSRAERMSLAEWTLRGLVEGSALTMFRDVHYTPIHVTQLAQVVRQVWERGLVGLYHAAGSTRLSKYDFALSLAATFGLGASNVHAGSVDDAGLAAPRPKNLALSSMRLAQAIGRPLPRASDGIRLMKHQYDSGWVSRIKGRPTGQGYRFWETK